MPRNATITLRTAAEWTSLNPYLRPNEIGYETDTLKFKIGPGYWNTVAGYFTREVLAKQLAANVAIVSSVVLSNTSLSVSLEVGNYILRAILHVDPSATGGFKYAFAGSASATNFIAQHLIRDTSTGAVLAVTRATAIGFERDVGGGSANIWCEVEGSLEVNAAGTFILQAAQKTSNAVASTLLRGSTMTLTKVG